MQEKRKRSGWPPPYDVLAASKTLDPASASRMLRLLAASKTSGWASASHALSKEAARVPWKLFLLKNPMLVRHYGRRNVVLVSRKKARRSPTERPKREVPRALMK